MSYKLLCHSPQLKVERLTTIRPQIYGILYFIPQVCGILYFIPRVCSINVKLPHQYCHSLFDVWRLFAADCTNGQHTAKSLTCICRKTAKYNKKFSPNSNFFQKCACDGNLSGSPARLRKKALLKNAIVVEPCHNY